MIFLHVDESKKVRCDVQVCLSVCTNVPEIKRQFSIPLGALPRNGVD